MANIAFIKVTKEWVSVEELIGNSFSFDSTKTYILEGRGNGGVLVLESDTVPDSDSRAGNKLDGLGYKIAEYKVGIGTLYARREVNSLDSGLNISEKEEE